MKHARNMKYVSQEKLHYFKGIFNFWKNRQQELWEHSDPKIAMNFKSLYPEESCVYWFETLQDHLYYTEICCYKFLVHFVVPSLKYSIWTLEEIRHSDLAKFQYLHIEYFKDGTTKWTCVTSSIALTITTSWIW